MRRRIRYFSVFFIPALVCLFGKSVLGKETQQLSIADTIRIEALLDSIPSLMPTDLPLSMALIEEADSLLTQLEQTLDRPFLRQKGEIVFLKSQGFSSQGKFDEGISELHTILSKPDLVAYFNGASKYYGLLGRLYQEKGNLIEARKSYLQAIQSSHISIETGVFYNNLGLVEYLMGSLFDASIHYKRALVLFESENATVQQKNSVRLNWGLVYYDLDSLDRAESQFREILKLVDTIPDTQLKGRLYLNLSAVYLKQSMWAQTISMLDSALHESILTEDPFLQVKIRFQRAACLMSMKGDQNRIQHEIEMAETLIKTNQLDAMNTDLELEKGNFEIFRGNYSQAKNHYNRALDAAIQLGNYTGQIHLLYRLAKVDSLGGNIVSAMTYYQRYHRLSDSLNRIKNDRMIDNIQMEYDLEKSEQEKEFISRELALSKSQSQHRFYFLLASIGILIVTVIALIIIASQRNRLLHTWKIIDNQNHRLKSMFRERQLILRLLTHDLRSPLMRIQIIVANLLGNWEENKGKEEETQAEIAEIAHAASEIDHFSERIMDAEDQPENLEISQKSGTKLNQRMESAIEKYQSKAFKKGIQIHKQFLPEEKTIQTNQEALQLVLENLLSNAIKYAPLNSEIDVCLTNQSDGYHYTIRDRGPGFQEADFSNMFKQFQTLSAQPTNGESSQGMGLYLSQKLCSQIGASLAIYNHSEKGAIASLIIPENT